MPVSERPRIFKFGRFNLKELISLATKLRGRPCTCDESSFPKSGSLNWVIFVNFDDGVEWAFRSPRLQFSMITEETASKMVVSEASTLKYLETHSSIPVPKVYSYSGTRDNAIDVPYILQSKAAGRPLSDYCWTEATILPPNYKHRTPQLPLSDSDRCKIMNQLGVIMSRLSNIRFDKIGSLFEDSEGRCAVGECLSPVFTWQSRDSLETRIDRGPFSREECYLKSLIYAFQSHVEELPLMPYFFFSPLPKQSDYPSWDSYLAAADRRGDFTFIGDKLEGSNNRFSYMVAGQVLEEMVPSLLSQSTGFTLSHPDLHTGNIFVDEELNITCIIDWSSATTGPVTELLATPGLAGSSITPAPNLISSFQSGFSQESRIIESSIWDRAEMMWYISRLVRLLSGQDLFLLQNLYELVHKFKANGLSNSIDYGQLFLARALLPENKQLLSRLREDDLSSEELQEMEKE